MTREQYIQTLFDTYRLVSVLADKNDCKALRLRHKKLEKDLVLHSFPRPIAAYQVLCGIRCQNLPEIFDVIPLEDGQIVLEEYIDGMTVAQVMETGRYRYRGAARVLSALCDGLDVLHRRGLVHRDIKPENVMIDKTGRVVLIDFNASRRVSAGQRDTVIMGTVGYASPEQLGVSQSDARTDIYAAGVLFNVMLTGMHPGSQLARGRAGRIVRKCTHLNPADRFQSAAKLAAAL